MYLDGWLSRRWFLFLALVLYLTTGCASNRRALNEENPFYKRGMQLQQEGNYEDAIAAFRHCLQYSPESYKANLQLALMYEDHKQDYPQAIVHYKIYLKNSNDTENIEVARQWLSRAERKYYKTLHLFYGDPIVERNTRQTFGEQDKHIRFDSDFENTSDQTQDESVAYENSDIPHDQNSIGSSDLRSTVLSAAAGSPENIDSYSYYTVQEGDTLVHIAEELFGSQKYWQNLYDYNKDTLSAPGRLQIGQKLKIPRTAGR